MPEAPNPIAAPIIATLVAKSLTHALGSVASEGMNHLMPHNGRQSGFIASDRENAGVDSNLAAGQRERVFRLIIFDDAHVPFEGIGRLRVLRLFGNLDNPVGDASDRFHLSGIIGDLDFRVTQNLRVGFSAHTVFVAFRDGHKLPAPRVRIDGAPTGLNKNHDDKHGLKKQRGSSVSHAGLPKALSRRIIPSSTHV